MCHTMYVVLSIWHLFIVEEIFSDHLKKIFSSWRPNLTKREVLHGGGKVQIFLYCPQLNLTQGEVVSQCKLGSCRGRKRIMRSPLKVDWQRKAVKNKRQPQNKLEL